MMTPEMMEQEIQTQRLMIQALRQDLSELRADMPKKLFTVWYKKFHRPQESQVSGHNMNEARAAFVKYCGRHKMTFISIMPFLMDMELPPAPERTAQKDPQDEEKYLAEISVVQQANLVNAVAAARTMRTPLQPAPANQPSAEEMAAATADIE